MAPQQLRYGVRSGLRIDHLLMDVAHENQILVTVEVTSGRLVLASRTFFTLRDDVRVLTKENVGVEGQLKAAARK